MSLPASPANLYLWLSLLAACVGCGGEERATPSRPRPEPSRSAAASTGYRVIESAASGAERRFPGGVVIGSVQFAGRAPDLATVTSPRHEDVCGASPSVPALVVGRRRGVRDAVVEFTGVREGHVPISTAPQTVRVAGCRYSPRVLAAVVGTEVVFENDDAFLHNVHVTRDGVTVLDAALAETHATLRLRLETPGIYRIVDDAGFPAMSGFIYVTTHPYVAVTDADGHLEARQVPAGQYLVRMWHEGFLETGERESGRPRFSAPVVLDRWLSVTEGQDHTIDFQFDVGSAENTLGGATHGAP